jgi:hypothetical protein
MGSPIMERIVIAITYDAVGLRSEGMVVLGAYGWFEIRRAFACGSG